MSGLREPEFSGRPGEAGIPANLPADDALAVVAEIQAFASLRRHLAAGHPDAGELAGLVVTLAERLSPGGAAPSTLPADFLAEAALLQAQAWLASGRFGEAARLALVTERMAVPEGSCDPHLGIEIEATAAMLAFAHGDLPASAERWQDAGKLAYQIKDPHLLGQAATAEAWVRLISEDPEGARRAFAKAQGAPRPHWIGVLERIEMWRRAKVEQTRVN